MQRHHRYVLIESLNCYDSFNNLSFLRVYSLSWCFILAPLLFSLLNLTLGLLVSNLTNQKLCTSFTLVPRLLFIYSILMLLSWLFSLVSIMKNFPHERTKADANVIKDIATTICNETEFNR